MNQRARLRASLLLLMLIIGTIGGGCRTRPRTIAKHPTVASLVPSATDLLIGTGLRDHLVAVSNVDADRPETAQFPRVGDYQNLDWEQLADLRPDILITFMAPELVPPALKQKCDSLNIRLLLLRTERLDDIFAAITTLGDELHEKPKAEAALKRLRDQLDSVRRRVAGKAPVPTLVVNGPSGNSVVGRNTFIDDVLRSAAGENVISATGWVSIDGEKLRSLRPQVILQLLPDASQQVVEEADRVWQSAPDLPAVRNHRVYLLRQWYVQQSGWHVGDLAELFASHLHADARP